MFVDSRTLSQGTVIFSDVCIVGAGPAGISIAKEFLFNNLKVCILESGDINFDKSSVSLSEGEYVGDPFSPLKDMRHRQFGGMSNLWNVVLHEGRLGVRYTDFDAIDFEKRDWVPYSGWPFTKEDLIPFYKRAHAFCQLGAYDYSTTPWETERTPCLKMKGDRIISTMYKFGPSKIYTTEYRDQLDRSSNITTYTNASVIEIETDEIGQIVTRIHAASFSANKFSVNAKFFILAAGGMENARLLLLSNRVQKNGLGNNHDVVGRYFMDHPLVCSGFIFPYDKRAISSMGLYDKRRVNNETVMGKFQLADHVLRRDKLLNMSMMVFPRDKKFNSEAKASARALFSVFKKRKIPINILKHLQNISLHGNELITDLYKHRIKKEVVKPNLAFGEWSTTNIKDQKKYVKFELMSQTEQTPHPDNRVTLSTKLDKLGCPQVKLTNYWNEIDKESVKKAETIFAEEFFAAGLGQMEIKPLDQQTVVLSTHHNMGTTRMNNNCRLGVVDENCKVHNISNLFIAGSSVFPTGSFANPTLTIIALSIRLADNLKELLGVL
jgi:choline dehydrogenase-like flavoprotein